MAWNTLTEIKMRSRDKSVESFFIQHDGNFYRLQNEFGNISIEFDVSSGYELVEVLGAHIMDDINQEINTFMNDEDARRDDRDVNGTSVEVTSTLRTGDNDQSQSVQIDLFKYDRAVKR